jgi:hypothetical protein
MQGAAIISSLQEERKTMKKINCLLIALVTSIGLAACNGGSSSSPSPTPAPNPPTTDTYTLKSTVNSPSNQVYTSFGSNGSSAYVATDGGFYQVSGNSTTLVNNTPNIIVIAGSNGNTYYVPVESDTIYNSNGTVIGTVDSQYGFITAVSPATSNGSIFFGTVSGYVGLLNNPAGKQISQIVGATGPVMAIGCIASGSCNSGNQGAMALVAPQTSLPDFESSTYVDSPSSYNYTTSFYYYNLGTWVPVTYNPVVSTNNTITYYTAESNPGTMNPVPTEYQYSLSNVNEFVTSVAFSDGNIYVGTNLFNIYAATNYACNNGQYKQNSCPVVFGKPLNVNSDAQVTPLGWVQNGSVGIISLSVQSNGTLMAISQESDTYARVYVSDTNSY